MGSETKVPRLLTIQEASEQTGLPRWRLYELIARGTGPACMRVGRTIRISAAALVHWIEQGHTNS